MNATAKAARPPAAKPKFWRTPAFRIGGSVVVLALLLTFIPYRQVWSAVARIPPGLSLTLLGVYMFLHLIGVVKWRLLINLAGADMTFLQCVRCYYGGLFGNVFLPSLVGGDFVRAGMAFTVSDARAAIVLGSLADRVQDVIGLAMLAGLGVILGPRSLDAHSRQVFWGVGGLLVVAGAAGIGAFFVIPARKFPWKVRRIMVKLRTGVWSMYRRPGRMACCFGLGMLLQSLQVLINYRLGVASGLSVSFATWLFAWPLAKISALAPVTQGGIGVREVALVALLVPFGAPPALSAAAGLVFEAITTFGGLIAGLVAFVIGRISPAGTEKRRGVPEFAAEEAKATNG